MIVTLEKIKQDFLKSVNEIVAFIDFIDICKTQDFSYARTSKFFKDISDSAELIKDSIVKTNDIQYNAIIISLYGSFELAIKDATNTYIKFCINNGFQLADKLSRDYISSVIKILDRCSLNENKNIIRDLHLFFNENDISKFSSELSLHNYQNLRTDIVRKIANSIEMPNFFDSIKQSNEFLSYIKDQQALSSEEQARLYVNRVNNAFQYIDEVVANRNLIAHKGHTDNRFDYKTLKEFIIREFTIFVCHYIESLKNNWYKNCIQYNKNIQEVKVSEIFDNKIICFNTNSSIIDKHTKILIKNGKNKCEIASVDSIQHNHQNIEQSDYNQDISCLLNKTCKKTFNYFLYVR